jgi:hypothetical protein
MNHNKLIFTAITLLSFLFFVHCASVKTLYLPTFEAEIEYYDHTAKFFENKALEKCKLQGEHQLGKYLCVNWLHLHQDGSIEQMETAKEIASPAYTIPPGSILFFDQGESQWKNVYFSQNTLYADSIRIKGGNKVSTSFYSNGRLKNCFLAQDQYIQGIPCAASPFHYMHFSKEGQLQMATLSEDIILQGKSYKKGTTIRLGEESIEVVE